MRRKIWEKETFGSLGIVYFLVVIKCFFFLFYVSEGLPVEHSKGYPVSVKKLTTFRLCWLYVFYIFAVDILFSEDQF